VILLVAEAGALVAISAPVMGTINIVQNIQQQVVQITNTVLYQTLGVVRDLTKEGAGTARDTVKAGAIVGRGMTSALSKAWSTIERVGSISLKYFFKVVEKATGSPESVIVAILIYRVVDWGVAISPESIDNVLNQLKKNIDTLRFEIPSVSLPRINITEVSKGVEDFFNNVKAKIYDLQKSLNIPPPGWVDIGCGPPPGKLDILGWVRYGLCKTAEGLVNGLIRLGYEIARLGLFIASKVLDFVALLVDFVKTVSVWFITLVGLVINGIITGIELVVNGFIAIGNFVIGVILEWVIKKPILFIIDYIVRPIAIFIVNGFNWIKNSMKTILCEYLKISPFALGFRYALRSSDREAKRGLLRSVFGGLAKGFVAFALTNITVAVLVPECSLVPNVEATIPTPLPPDKLTMDRPPMSYTSITKIGVVVGEVERAKTPYVYNARVLKSIEATELSNAKAPELNTATSIISANVVEQSSATAPQSYSSSTYISVKTVE
jgi:hypothetical protein